MPTTTDARAFIELAGDHPVIDVRSPAEFQRGHVPKAFNIALFDDAERARVGIAYKQVGREHAIALGLNIVSPKLDFLVRRVHAIAPHGEVLVHCWRGGMRSAGVAGLLEQRGFRPHILQGGYKAYRNEIHRCFAQPRRIMILSGLSGVGKTELLQALRDQGEQVVDLEQLAHHRGSAFGGIGQPSQPTVEQFENNLFDVWRNLDPSKIVWMEDEGHAIGQVVLPQAMLDQMRDSPALFLQVDSTLRAEYLVQQYGALPADELALAIDRIKKRLGGERSKMAHRALAENNLRIVAEIVLEYYDKAYLHASQKRSHNRFTYLPIPRPADLTAIPKLRQLAGSISQVPKSSLQPRKRALVG